MTSSIPYPTCASQIQGSPYEGRDDFFYCFNLFSVEPDDNGTLHLATTPDMPVLVNKKEIRDEIADKTGIILPLRAEVSKKTVPDDVRRYWPKINWDRMYTGAGGIFAHVLDQKGTDRLYLLQNSLDKPVNPGRWNTASGLISSRRPDETIALEGIEETGVFLVQDSRLVGLVPDLSLCLPNLSAAFALEDCAVTMKQAQEHHVRARLETAHPDQAQKPIEWKKARCLPIHQDICDGIVVSMMGQDFKMVAHVVRDDKAMSVNMHVPVALHEGGSYIAADPEKFGRKAGLFTCAEAENLDTIPAPRNYIERLRACKPSV